MASPRLRLRGHRLPPAWFVFRFNRRTSASRGMLFYRLMQQAVMTGPVTHHNVVEGLSIPPSSE